jgi:short subunit dehydrogenase-like uncharacterized protein
MIYGTAGYTAGLAIERLETEGLTIEKENQLCNQQYHKS